MPNETPLADESRASFCGQKSCSPRDPYCLYNSCAHLYQMRHILQQFITLCANTSATIILLDGTTVTGRLNSLYPANCGNLLMLANDSNVITTVIPICQIAAFTPTCNACLDYLPAPHHSADCCTYACQESLQAYLSTTRDSVILQHNNTAIATGTVSCAAWGIVAITATSSTDATPTTTYVALDAISTVTTDN